MQIKINENEYWWGISVSEGTALPLGRDDNAILPINGRGNGDEYVTVTVEVPKNLSDKQKELLYEFDKDCEYIKKKSFMDKMKNVFK